jgi:uncharacterized protein
MTMEAGIDRVILPPVARQELDALCRRCGVARLAFFGPVTTDVFDPATSDIDALVAFKPETASRAFDAFFDLKHGLEAIFQRPVDLVTERSLRNQYLIREIESSRVLVYAA